MLDIDKAISGIKHCTKYVTAHSRNERDCTRFDTLCPYYYGGNCRKELANDTLELLQKLKEQNCQYWEQCKVYICPKCGNELHERPDFISTIYPPKRLYECGCGWAEFH